MSGSSIRRPRTRTLLLLCAPVLGLGLMQPGLSAERTKASAKTSDRLAFTADEALAARPGGFSAGVRIPGDDPAAFTRLLAGAAAASEPWLVLSGGGENGAFAAGLLKGWSAAGTRPAFGVITGVSTGAMIAPFAFIGAAGDEPLQRNYTEISAADVFEFGGTTEALTDTWPLKQRIERAVTPALLAAIAAEHAKGRRLLVATTALDAERPILWDMGALASLGGPKALALFRDIVLASSAVPGVFPPVMIEATAGARTIREMHADGGATAPYYLAPEAMLLATRPAALPTHRVYLVVNQALSPQFQMATRTTLGILGRSLSAAIKAQTRVALAVGRRFAKATDLDLRIAEIDGRFTRTTTAPFDQDYMKALFAHGEALGRAGTAFTGPEDPAGGTDLPAVSLTGAAGARATGEGAVETLAGR